MTLLGGNWACLTRARERLRRLRLSRPQVDDTDTECP